MTGLTNGSPKANTEAKCAVARASCPWAPAGVPPRPARPRTVTHTLRLHFQATRRSQRPLTSVERNELRRPQRLRRGDMQDVETARSELRGMAFTESSGNAKHHGPSHG